MRGLLVASLLCLAAVASVHAGTIGQSQRDPFEHEGRIVGGQDTTIRAHPYQVSLQSKSGSHFCGGSVLNADTIVTAAHCLVGQTASATFVRLGSTLYNEGGIVRAVRDIIYHDKYNSKTMEYDVGIMKLAERVEETDDIQYVELAKETPPTGTRAVVTGWGSKCYFWCVSLPKVLQEVYVDIVDWETCRSDKYKYGDSIYQSMVCAYEVNKDACQGDSGGPLVVGKNTLVGIVSWGYGCASEGYPGVYASVPDLRGWIETEAARL